MSLIRRLILAFALMAGIAPAVAQAPPPVPSLPDAERRTSFSLTAQTGPFSVGFALYGDSTDYGDWLQVWLCTSAPLTPCSQLTAVTDWTLSSATGSLATIPRPITDATITLNAARTGTLQIVGARRPRRTSQFAENRGVASRDLNQTVTDLVAQNRENWDLQQRQLRGQPGELISALQPATTRAGGILCWDATGLIPQTCAAGSSGTANVVGPNVSVVGHLATFGNTLGTVLTDGGLVGGGNLIGPIPSVSTVNHAATFKDSGAINIIDSGLTLTPSTGTLTLTNAKTLTVDNSLELAGTDGTKMTFPTTSATLARTDAANTFTGHQTIEGVTTTGATGTGKLVFDTSPTVSNPTVTGSLIATGLVTMADLVTGGQDTILGYFTSATASATAVPDCGNSLTYATGTHTFGCNAGAGTGNVANSGTPTANQIAQWTSATVIQGVNLASLLTAGAGISITGTTSPTVALALNSATLQSNPANPTATTSVGGVMMGLGSTCKLTPLYSTRVKVEFIGDVANTSSGQTSTHKVFFGTGAAPANAAAITGTQVGNQHVNDAPGASFREPFSNGGIITGLTVGVAIWADLSLASSSGTSTFSNLSCNLSEQL